MDEKERIESTVKEAKDSLEKAEESLSDLESSLAEIGEDITGERYREIISALKTGFGQMNRFLNDIEEGKRQ